MTVPVSAWCPTCQQDTLPMSDDRCAFCDGQTESGRPEDVDVNDQPGGSP